MAKIEKDLNSLLMQMKEEGEKADLKFSIKKLKSWYRVPSVHGK